jgi:hypothetical protein
MQPRRGAVLPFTKNDEEPTAFTPVHNEADLMQRREPLAVPTI